MSKRNLSKQKPWVRPTAYAVLIAIAAQVCFPTASFALTSGPQQPEASNFTPADVSNLVDPFTGDFSYNIPMFEIGGYPVNLSYNSGITMDQEATWVGLGWNLNTGAITRDVRGIPDDFWGDKVKRDYYTKPNITAGGTVGFGYEFAGFPASISAGLQMKYNNYSGFSVGQTLNGGIQFSNGVNLGLGLSTTNGGLDINPNVSFSADMGSKDKTNYKGSLGFGLNINSRTGLSQMSLNASVSAGKDAKNKNGKPDGYKYNASAGGGGSISFLNPTYTPQNMLPYQNFNFSGNFKIGGSAVFSDFSGTISGFYSEQKLATNTVINPAYGYMYSEKGQYIDNATHDFNREKDGTFTNNTASLPLTNYTYDAFNIKAQGIGGSFRPFRNEVGHLFDPSMVNPSAGGSFGVEVDLGQAVDVGIDVNVNWNESKSGKWNNSNPMKDQLKFREPFDNTLKENFFFKMVGEKVGETDPAYLDRIQSDKSVRIGLESANEPMTLNTLVSENTNNTTQSKTINNNNYRGTRIIRNTSIQCFTVAEVKHGFPAYTKYLPACAQDHHIGLIIVTTANGTRYVFGLPAYNKVKREVTMAVGKTIEGVTGLSPDANNLVQYGSADASINNRKGIDNYYDMTETPPYVYTWYLTEVLSPDYSDLTGDGATPDDLGGYVKFNYGQQLANGMVIADIPNYQWRTPSTAGSNKATFIKGLRTLDTDDKATYLYGTKDIWYPNSIESKTQYIKFVYSSREDGYGVTGEHAGIGGTPQKRIDKINVFSRQDYLTNTTGAVPLKTIYFEYDYSLCQGVWNRIPATGGKLTLKKVYFTYRNSSKAKYSSYSFQYPSGSGNPSYDPNANDRWGTYRSNSTNTSNGVPKNEEFPYTLQDKASLAPGTRKTLVDDLAKAWNLQAITLPTGGKINIEYEADDYAYVQDKKACHMFPIVGATNTSNGSLTNRLYTGNGTYQNNNYLVFDLEKPILASSPDPNKLVKEQYFDDPNKPESNGPSKLLYFRFLTNVNIGLEATRLNEYVSGYADVESSNYCGVYTPSLSGGSYYRGWVKLKELTPDAGGTQPYQQISKAGWAFSRINTPFYANGQPTPGQASPGDFIKTILNADIIAQLIQFFQGPNNKMQSQGFSCEFVPGSSWVRLYDPDGFKYGGGHRVKSIKISDQWNSMESSESAFEYGQEYAYSNENGTASSGVASYEPMYGADENPFRIPVFYKKEYGPLIPDDRFYLEEPFGECFFPSPVVGYSRVKISNLKRANVNITATGYTIKEFYTAKDFPTITQRTRLDEHRAKIDPVLAIISPYVFDFMTASQGFSIELNDMHGKPKMEAVYQQDQDATVGNEVKISEVKHFYKQEVTDATQINNNMLVMEKDGDIKQHEIGTEVDAVADFRESSSFAGNIDVGFNTDYTQFGPIPLIILAVFPKVKFEDTRFRSATVTKVTNRYGIEIKTEAYDLGSKVATENMLFNEISGEPLSTKVNNEYEDERYTLSVPAYWGYKSMGHGSNNEGLTMLAENTGVGIYTVWRRNTGKILVSNPDDYFEPGDECMVTFVDQPGRYVTNTSNVNSNYVNRVWVARDDAGTPSVDSDDKWYFIDQYGSRFIQSDNFKTAIFKVVRSGHRNVLEPKIAEYATLKKPVTTFANGGTLQIDNTKNVLSATGQTFNEQWKNLKRYDNCNPYSVCVCNTLQFASEYMNMMANIFTNHTEFVYGKVLLYDQYGYYNGLTPAIVNEFLATNTLCSSVSPVTKVELVHGLHTSVASWIPGTDPSFLTGSTLGFEVMIHDGVDSCTNCRPVQFSLILPSAVPSSYLNPTPGIGCTGSDMYSLYQPVTINGVDMVLKLTPSGSPAYGQCGRAFRDCKVYEYVDNDDNVGDSVNPYIKNILGKWRPSESYTLIQEREGDVDTQVDLRSQGYINNYTNFWYLNTGQWVYNAAADYHWKRTTTMTQYHPSGPQVEEKNALDIYSAAQYGYFEQLAVAVAQNAQYKEIGYDGFEDYTYLNGSVPQYSTPYNCKKLDHFKFEGDALVITQEEHHTGKNSLEVNQGNTISMQRNLQPATGYRTTRSVPYQLMQDDLMEFFGPQTNTDAKTFVFSFWIKQKNYTPVMFDYTQSSGNILLGSSTLIVAGSLKKSPIIDGWQKFEYLFTIPASTPSGILKVQLISSSGATKTWFDDVRIHPFNSSMKSYVYDPLDLRFMAELDENNYATFYEYDEDGALIRVKKETERGIMTIQENRYGSYKYE